MKKVLLFLLCLTVFLQPLIALGESVSLPEKLQLQIDAGSGFKGNYSIGLSKIDDTSAPKLLEGEISYIKTDEEHYTLMDGENTFMEIAIKDDKIHVNMGEDSFSISSLAFRLAEELKGKLLPYLNIPSTLDLFSAVLSTKPQISESTSMLEKQKLDQINSTLQNALTKYSTDIDLWLESHLSASEKQKLEDGTEILGMEYVVPVDDIKDMIKTLIFDIKQDDELINAMAQYLPLEYRNMLLVFNQTDYVSAVIDYLPIVGDVRLGKTFTFKGEPVSTHLSLPIYDATSGNFTLNYINTIDRISLQEVQEIKLFNDKESVSIKYVAVEVEGVKNFKGEINNISSEGDVKNNAILFDVNAEIKDFVDELGKNNLHYIYSGEIKNNDEFLKTLTDAEKASYYNIDSYNFEYSTIYSSGVAKNTSTKLQRLIDVKNNSKNIWFNFNLDAKTTTFWETESVNAENSNEYNLLNEADWDSLVKKALELLNVIIEQKHIIVPVELGADVSEFFGQEFIIPDITATPVPQTTPEPVAEIENSEAPLASPELQKTEQNNAEEINSQDNISENSEELNTTGESNSSEMPIESTLAP